MSYAAVPGVVETRESFAETTLVVDPARLIEASTSLRDEHGFNFLADIAAADYLGWGEQAVAGYIGTAAGRDIHMPGSQGLARVPDPKPKRFSVSYHLLRVGDDPARVRLQVWLDDGEPIASVIPVWPAADWFEREAWDMLGIHFEGHENLVRILMPEDWEGHPLRKDYPLGGEPVPLLGRGLMSVLPSTRIYEGTRIPHPVPTILEVDPEKHRLDDILRVNFGPNHPSTHGVLRLVVDLDGETVAGIRAVIGYLHTGFEKNMEHKSWWKSVTYAPRIDYVSFHANELLYVLAIEKLLGIEVPRRAVWARMALAELNRIHSHLVWLGTSALELGAISLFWYCFDDRDQILDLFEMAGGTRMHTRYVQVGGIAEDLPPDFTKEARKFCASMPKSVDEYEAILDRNAIWIERTVGVGLLSADDALALAQSGPMLRSTGVDWDLRKAEPYLAYDEVEFDVPVYPNGDVYDRYRVHMDEMRESVHIVEQCLDRLDEIDGEPWIADDRKVVLPPRHELHTSMESLIHHFKIVTEGFAVPEGEIYVAIESPRGEAGCYLVSDGGARPWRVKFRAPSFAALQATATIVQELLIADLIAAGGSLDPVMGDADR